MKKFDLHWIHRAFFLCFMDVISIMACSAAALWIRFDFQFHNVSAEYWENLGKILPFWVISLGIIYYCMRLYHSIWQYAGISEVICATKAYVIMLPVATLEIILFQIHLPRSVYFIAYCLSYACCIGIRMSYRVIRSYVRNIHERNDSKIEQIMVIGGGATARYLIREYQSSRHIKGYVRCIIDDNPNKRGRTLEGVRIVGGRNEILQMAEKYNISRIVFAIPSAKKEDRSEILNICKETGCKLQAVPGIYQFVTDEVHISQLKDVDICDLLGRNEIHVNNCDVRSEIHNNVVLVTGGGGTIGSELCRQIAAQEPKQLIIFDIYENGAYEIQQELKRKYPKLSVVTLIGSVRNTSRVQFVLEKYHPQIVYHAAAHKHVPLMEESPNEAIKNNVLGTYKMAVASAEAGVEKFLLISTDKAVNPTNVMGASKRLCEMIVQMMNRRYVNTDFMAVRFGNVLGSNGSVIPLFKKQIEEGGPVTVTDKNIIRYFMTISEAVSLVLQASHYAKGGEIFVLDMGDAVRIDDLARNLIKLSGYIPDEDIKIVYTGLRPGEKLYEELLMDEEGMKSTANEKIFVGQPIAMDDEKFERDIKRLEEVSDSESEMIQQLIAEIVPTYCPTCVEMCENEPLRSVI